MVPELKTYLDLSKLTSRPEFKALADQWVKTQSYKRSMFKQYTKYKQYNQTSEGYKSGYGSGSAQGSPCRKPIAVSIVVNSDTWPEPLEANKLTTPAKTSEAKPIVSYLKWSVTSPHNAPRKGMRLRVLIKEDMIERLGESEVMATVGGK